MQNNIPQHIAIIMDGNGRWAKKLGEDRIVGHKHGVGSVRTTLETAVELGVKYLTLYTFSTENWNRPVDEVNGLMSLLSSTIKQELPTLLDNNIRLLVIGDHDRINPDLWNEMQISIDKTSHCDGLTLILALSYSGRWDILQATKRISEDVANGKLNPSEIDQSCYNQYLSTAGIPDPDLMIRTSGEFRISNFLLWQTAYTEYYFTPVLWPDFSKQDFLDAIENYSQRQRRLGKVENQISQ